MMTRMELLLYFREDVAFEIAQQPVGVRGEIMSWTKADPVLLFGSGVAREG
jgi:hypothetical protein